MICLIFGGDLVWRCLIHLGVINVGDYQPHLLVVVIIKIKLPKCQIKVTAKDKCLYRKVMSGS